MHCRQQFYGDLIILKHVSAYTLLFLEFLFGVIIFGILCFFNNGKADILLLTKDKSLAMWTTGEHEEPVFKKSLT